jgi:hypothetical protein
MLQMLSTGTYKRAQMSVPHQFGGNLIMANPVSGAIRVFMRNILEGSIHMRKINSEETLKKMFNER